MYFCLLITVVICLSHYSVNLRWQRASSSRPHSWYPEQYLVEKPKASFPHSRPLHTLKPFLPARPGHAHPRPHGARSQPQVSAAPGTALGRAGPRDGTSRARRPLNFSPMYRMTERRVWSADLRAVGVKGRNGHNFINP